MMKCMKSKIIQAKTNHKWEECVYIVTAVFWLVTVYQCQNKRKSYHLYIEVSKIGAGY